MPNKAIFLDRDDTIIEDTGYINNPDLVKLLDGVPEALSSMKAMGYKLVVVSNQSGVARGILTEEILGQIHKRLEQLLAQKGIALDKIYYCPYHPEGVIPKYRKDSDLRKPNPGMLLLAGKDLDIEMAESWMVGNSIRDIEAGRRAGCRTVMIESRSHEQKLQPGEPGPDYRAVNLKEVVNIIKMRARTGQKTVSTNISATPAQATTVIKEEPKESAGPQEPVISKQETPPQPSEPLASKPKIEQQQTIEELLKNILEQIKKMQRTNLFGEFSITRLIAGIAQGLVFLCLLASIWFLTSPTKEFNHVMISIGFAVVLQLMAMTFYIMRGPK